MPDRTTTIIVSSIVVLIVLIAWLYAELTAAINFIEVGPPPYNLEHFDMLVGSLGSFILSGALVWLYYTQTSLLKKQKDIAKSQTQVQERQANLMSTEHSPAISAELYELVTSRDLNQVGIEISNTGNGPFNQLYARTSLAISNREFRDVFEGKMTRLEPLIGSNINPILSPGESKILYTPFYFSVYDRQNEEVLTEEGGLLLHALNQAGVSSVSVSIHIVGVDMFDKRESPLTGPYLEILNIQFSIESSSPEEIRRRYHEAIHRRRQSMLPLG